MSHRKPRASEAETEMQAELDTYKEALDNLSPPFYASCRRRAGPLLPEQIHRFAYRYDYQNITLPKIAGDGLKLARSSNTAAAGGTVKYAEGFVPNVHGDTGSAGGIGCGGFSGIMEPGPAAGAWGGLRRQENNGIQKLQAIRLSILPVSRLLIHCCTGAYPSSVGGAVRMKTDRHHRADPGGSAAPVAR